MIYVKYLGRKSVQNEESHIYGFYIFSWIHKKVWNAFSLLNQITLDLTSFGTKFKKTAQSFKRIHVHVAFSNI